MSGSVSRSNTRVDIQEVIRLKIELRDEIKGELREEFRQMVEGMRGISDARYEAIKAFETNMEVDLDRRIGGTERIYDTRINAMDRASEVLAENVNRVPTLLDREVKALRDFFAERIAALNNSLSDKFEAISRQFYERDERSKMMEVAQKEMAAQSSASASIAVTAALNAQKEAAGKAEISTSKQIDGLQQLLASNAKAVDDKIGVINGRLDRGEGVSSGSSNYRTENRLDTGQVISYVVAAAAVLGLIMTVVMGNNGKQRDAVTTSGEHPTIVSPAVIPVAPKP